LYHFRDSIRLAEIQRCRTNDAERAPFLGLYGAYAMLVMITLRTRFEVPILSGFTDMIGLQSKKRPSDLDHALFGWFVVKCNICLWIHMQYLPIR